MKKEFTTTKITFPTTTITTTKATTKTTTKMKKTELKNLEKEKLIELLVELSKLNKDNEAFLKTRLSTDYNDYYKLSCKKIDNAFSCFELMSLKDARQALSNFKKSKPENSRLIDLYLYYIRRAYKLEETDWRFQENFYSAIERVFGMIVDILKKDPSLKEKYDASIKKIISQANEGWNHQDTLKDMYEEI
ncbi:MAG: hypothetical protein ACOCZ6_03590 [Nanoarchaeota archaeon]